MLPQRNRNAPEAEIQEDVSREDIVSAFRTAMVGHFRSHIPGTNINESTLLASDYLNHFHELVMLFEALASEPQGFAEDLKAWRPLTYEEHFSQSGFRDKNLAIAAYRRAPSKVRARFDEAVSRLHGEALTLVATVGGQLDNGQSLEGACQEATSRLRVLIDEANAIATGEVPAEPGDTEPQSETSSQAAIDAMFGANLNLGRFDP
jgi:hypothetical protein